MPDVDREKSQSLRKELRDLLEQAIAASKPLGVHQEHFQALREKTSQGDLIVGVIGITSSGKSAFLNALMGEREALLPEEARATTNLLVKCRRGQRKEATLYYTGGKVVHLRGAALNPERMAALCSERLNPGNRNGIAAIELTSPHSIIPEGLVLVDTPGLDAYGCEGHEELTLRRFLPMADIVIYLSSIRNPFKKADLKGIAAVIENDQRVLFVLSQIDLERDSTECGKIWKTKQAKLQRHLDRLQDDVKSVAGLGSFGTVLVSSKLAKEGFGNRSSRMWKESGFDSVLAYLNRFADQLNHVYLVEAFSRRIERELASAIRTGQARLVEDSTRLGPSSGAQVATRAQALRDAFRQAGQDLKTSIMKARAFFVEGREGDHAMASLRNVRTAEALKHCFDAEQSFWSGLVNSMNEILDPLQQRLRTTLKEMEVDHDRVGTARRSLVTSIPRSGAYVTTFKQEVRVRGWFDSPKFWPKSEVQTIEEIDRAGALKALQAYAGSQAAAARDHLAWWQGHVEQAYLRPLEDAKTREEAAEAESSRREALSRSQSEELRAAVQELEGLLQKAGSIRDGALKASTGKPEEVTPLSRTSEAKAPIPQNAMAALRQVLLASRESTFQQGFKKSLAEAAPGGANSKVLLLGPRRLQHLRLLSLLGHGLGRQDYLESIPANRWIVAGTGPTFGFSLPVCPVPSLSGSTIQGITLVIAPEDEQLPEGILWPELLGWADVVGFELNAPRIAAGLADLHRAPYRPHLAATGSRILYTCADGALLSDRLQELPDILQLAGETEFGPRPWFIFEDYEWRYTPLSRLLRQHGAGASHSRELLRRWSKEERLAHSPPFTREALEALFGKND